MTKSIIVGVDPGTTVGLAILDIYGNVITVASKKEMGINEIIKFITKFGRPLIISSDVNPIPRTVEKIAKHLNAKPYFPKESLRVGEKHDLVKDFSLIKDEHEIDALASSIKAWKSYRQFFSSIEEELQKYGFSEFFDDIVVKIVNGEFDNIEEAVETLKKSKFEEKKDGSKELIQKLNRMIFEKDRYIETLKERIDSLSKYINKSRWKSKSFEKPSAGLDRQQEEIKKLEKYNKLLKDFIKIESKNLVPLIEADDLEETNEIIGLEDKFIFSDYLENLNQFNRYKIKGLITTSDMDKRIMKELEFPVIKVDEKAIEDIDGIKTIKLEALEKELKKAKKIGLVEWLGKYKRRKL